MSTGYKIKGGGGNTLSWNIDIGSDVGFDIEDSWNNLLEGNIHVDRRVIQEYGEEFKDVIYAVRDSKDYEAMLALGSILNSEPNHAIVGWEILIKKFGIQIGRFSAKILEGIFSSAAYGMLKLALKEHGIDLP
jgi:hypothetical protein